MPYDPKLGKFDPNPPAWLTLLRKIAGWNPPGYKDPAREILKPILKKEPEGVFSQARGEKPRVKPLNLSKETLRKLATQGRADKNLEKMQAEQNPLRNERQGLILALSEASCVGMSACPNCPDNVEQANRQQSDYCPGANFTNDEICSLANACRQQDYFSGDPYGDLCVTARGGGAGGDLGGC